MSESGLNPSVAGHPFGSANDHSLGKLMPHQLDLDGQHRIYEYS